METTEFTESEEIYPTRTVTAGKRMGKRSSPRNRELEVAVDNSYGTRTVNEPESRREESTDDSTESNRQVYTVQ